MFNTPFFLRTAICCLFVGVFAVLAPAQGNFYGKTDRPLRYHPDGTDFVIENGKGFFNRPLYGGNTAFRVDAGDKPEFVLYLPGRGGNLRFGFKTARGNKWLQDADKVTTRYRPGSMIYEVRDSFLGNGVLKLEVLATYETEGLVLRVSLQNAGAVDLVWAYGGANGERGRRDGDIGTEKVPVSEFFQLKPEFCKDNKFSIEANNFTLETKAAEMIGLMPKTTKLVIGDASLWNRLEGLLASAGKPTETPVIIGAMSLTNKQSEYFGLQKVNAVNVSSGKINESQQLEDQAQKSSFISRNDDLPQVFDEAEKYRKALANRVVVDTPDPFINAAAAALNVAGDSVWDEQQSAFMHGAVAWRTKLLGWRGPYLG
ncbi:MAG TPA: DUF4450 domain-containing protein, partial [Pyrinomonadaceae bacterium]|nr:DUF4450 domain-containing protein [Pyrinomonadaceae bacterium]